MSRTKRKLLKLVLKIEREDILEYLYIFVSGKLEGIPLKQDVSETDKLRDNISGMLSKIKRKDILNYIYIIVSDILAEQGICQ